MDVAAFHEAVPISCRATVSQVEPKDVLSILKAALAPR
jgi:hypothetical protein